MNYIEEYSINDAWRSVMWLCLKNGYDYKIEQGSYVGQIRKQLSFVTIRIKEPWRRPLAPIMPPNLPPPTTDDKIATYFSDYLMDDTLAKNEVYKYGSFIKPQIDRAIAKLWMSNGNTNQATITVGDTKSIHLTDPPCLKVIDIKIVNNRINISVFFRSWDLFAGLPENLGGLQLLKEYILEEINNREECCCSKNEYTKDGEIIAYSSGLHIYEQYFDLVQKLNIME